MPGDGGNRNEGAFFRVLWRTPADIASAKSKAKKGGKLVGGARERLSHQKKGRGRKRGFTYNFEAWPKGNQPAGEIRGKKSPFPGGQGKAWAACSLIKQSWLLVPDSGEKRRKEKGPPPSISLQQHQRKTRERERRWMMEEQKFFLFFLPAARWGEKMNAKGRRLGRLRRR